MFRVLKPWLLKCVMKMSYFCIALNSYFIGIVLFTYIISYMVILIFNLYAKNITYIQMESWEHFRGLGGGKVICEEKVFFSFLFQFLASWPSGHPAIQLSIDINWGTVFWRVFWTKKALRSTPGGTLHNSSASFV